MAGIGGALVGVAIMFLIGANTSGAATVVVLGAGHSAAFLFGTVVLIVAMRRRTGIWVLPGVLGRTVAVSTLVGLLGWGIHQLWFPSGRVATAVALVLLVALLGALYLGAIRLLGVSVADRLAPGTPEGETR